MKELLTPGKAMDSGVQKRSSMKSNIIDARHRYFRNNKGIMSDQKRSIFDSVKRCFETLTPNEAA